MNRKSNRYSYDHFSSDMLREISQYHGIDVVAELEQRLVEDLSNKIDKEIMNKILNQSIIESWWEDWSTKKVSL